LRRAFIPGVAADLAAREAMPGGHSACLELASNLDPASLLPQALRRLRRAVEVEAVSTDWESPAVGSSGSDDLNVALLIRTRPSKDELTLQLKRIEAELGRLRTAGMSARVAIDIDLFLFDGKVLEPDLWAQALLSVPVAEILPDLACPSSGETLTQAARRLATTTPIRPRPEFLPGRDTAGRIAPRPRGAWSRVTRSSRSRVIPAPVFPLHPDNSGRGPLWTA
jgi:2-amino-4-hydroxy-6-hydroxymethyldihydropteridine diphosphokinase